MLQQNPYLRPPEVMSPEKLAALERECAIHVLNRLKKLEILSERQGAMMVDVARLKDVSLKQLLGYTKDEAAHEKFHYLRHYGRVRILHLALEGMMAIPKDELNDKAVKPRPIFYAPKNKDQALDPKWIRRQDFIVAAWDFAHSSPDGRFPSAQDDAGYYEASIAATLYHPKYGAAYRDKTDHLLVRDPAVKGRFIPLTGEWFADQGVDFNVEYSVLDSSSRQRDSIAKSPRHFIHAYAPSILERGLVKLEDFRQISQGQSLENRQDKRIISSTGSVMIRGVMYYLGKKFGREHAQVSEVAPGIGGITTLDEAGTAKLTHVFDMYEAGDERLSSVTSGQVKPGQPAKRYGYAGSELTRVRPYYASEFVRPKPSEGIAERASRLKQKENLELLKDFFRPLEMNAGLNLSVLRLDEQLRLAEVISNMTPSNRRDFFEFARKQGADGVRAFLSVGTNPALARELLVLGDKLGPVLAQDIFKKYGSVLDAAHENAQELARDFSASGSSLSSGQMATLEQGLEKRAQSMLVDFCREITAARPGRSRLKTKEVLGMFERTREDMIVFSAVFRAVAKGRDIKFEEVRGMELGKSHPQELTKPEKEAMLDLSRRNWSEIPNMLEFIQHGLTRALETSSNLTEFYQLKKDGKLLAFMRIDDHGEYYYMGSLNVAPDTRGSGIGEALLKEAFERVAASGRPIEANVFPTTRVTEAYVEKFGFAVTGVVDIPVGEGKKPEKGFSIRVDSKLNEKLKTRGPEFTATRILNDIKAGRLEGPGYRIMSFDLKNQAEKMLDAVNSATSQGSAVSRFLIDPLKPSVRHLVFEAPDRRSDLN
ncbi:MAG: GNAT family N-acetyltransferase [Patescibacteria group bacterium]|nr:GNAT family N-acetyltransferase [Patescibacteria group bacterium]